MFKFFFILTIHLTIFHYNKYFFNIITLNNYARQVDNWADNEALRNPFQTFVKQKPIYRRSLSELPQSPNYNTPNLNRRSLGSDAMQSTPKSSTSMTNIPFVKKSNGEVEGNYSGLGRCGDDISSSGQSAVYTYIGISGPDKSPIYQNQRAVDKQKKIGVGGYVFDLKQHEEM